MASFRERFGLDYLKRAMEQSQAGVPRETPASDRSSLPRGMEEALIAYGRRIAEAMKAAPETRIKVFDLANALQVRMDTLLPVVSYFVDKGYVQRVEEDPIGNDLLVLTESGQKLIR